MNRDPLDDFGAGLFEVARNEAPPRGAEKRAIETAGRELSAARGAARHGLPRTAAKLLLLAAALALCAVFVLRREESESSIGPEIPRSLRPVPDLPSSAPASEASAPVVVKEPLPPPVAPPARSAPASLSEEIELLKAAETALAAGDTAGAFKSLDRYDNVLKGRTMRAEATLLRIETLTRAVRAEAASQLARRCVEQNPTSPLVDRARAFIQSEREE
jgi:hypothetical protein